MQTGSDTSVVTASVSPSWHEFVHYCNPHCEIGAVRDLVADVVDGQAAERLEVSV